MLKKTALFSLHKKLEARVVPFAGYKMPVQYPTGIKTEHLFCRQNAGLFDVSHMGQIVIEGEGAQPALEKLIPLDLDKLEINQQTYGFFTMENGGVLDDLIITRWGDEKFFLVINAACKEADISHLKNHLPETVKLKAMEDQALIALQGPKSAGLLAELFPEIQSLTFMRGCECSFTDKTIYITRSGYTGEDGFEISCPAEIAEQIADRLLLSEDVMAIGLGARDSLRLEAGLCLYGHDLDTQTTPIEAGLGWAISQSRRAGGSKQGDFLGARIILDQMQSGASRKRVGLDIEGRAPVREGSVIEDIQGRQIGLVTSGGFGPSVEKPVAMAYVESTYAESGTQVNAIVRGKNRPAKICKLPFITPNYFRG